MSKLILFSRHPSHSILRKTNFNLSVLTCMRLGSTTKGKLKYGCEINTPEAVKISANKKLMKEAFLKAGVRTAKWCPAKYLDLPTINKSGFQTNNDSTGIQGLAYPVIAKNIFGSRGTGNYKLNDETALKNWLKGKDLNNYIFEEFFKHGIEYRLHCTKQGCFYTCRKMVKKDAEHTWQRHSDNSIWILESNEKMFDRPYNWENIVAECVKALDAVGLDVAAFDVKVQSKKDKKGIERKEPDFIIIESNSAPSMAQVGIQKYIEIVPKIVESKLKK